MSGGIHAIKGFSYQAQVILDHLFPFFEKYGSDASIRPEGIEDLDLYWHDNGCEQREYVQIKKPREDTAGNRKPKPWKLSDAFDKLLPNAINNLTGNQYRQTWVFGDEVTDELQCLVNAGNEAYAKLKQIYLPTLHRLALDKTIKECKIKEGIVRQINKFEVTQQITLEDVKSDFIKYLEGAVVSREFCKNYEDNLSEIHAVFPCILSRITIKSTYGLEKEVEQRILVKLKEKYNLSQEVIKNTLFRNLVGFIDEISKQPGRMFGHEEFEVELRCVWPTMLPIRRSPHTEDYHVSRVDLIEDIFSWDSANVVEVMGASGSGKTMLAAELAESLKTDNNQKEIFYIEVRDGVSFRDVISGIAFYLRRINRSDAFGISIDSKLSNNERIQKIAKVFSDLDKEILTIVDFVDGGCSPPFSNDLSLFIRSMNNGVFQLVTLSQESVLVNFNQFDLDRYKIKSLNIRGLYFDEFTKLVSFYHNITDYSIISSIYNRATARRSIGLYAQLAHSLASSRSLDSMHEASQVAPEAMLSYVEQQRFTKVTQEAKISAKRLVCLYLPFQREDVINLFPEENIGLAIQELTMLGMLRKRPDELYEMHETIRAGIEANIALAFRQETHHVLAKWYQMNGNESASIFHFDQAGHHDKAYRKAKEAFLQGKQWEELYNYIIKNQLITKKELLETFRAQQKIDQIYLFSSILDQLQGEDVLEDLLKLLQNQPQRFAESYHDASACIQAIIRIDPEKLVELILYGIKYLSIADGKHAFIDAISTSIRSLPVTINSEILKIFDEQPIDIQERLLTLILLKPRRDSFSRLFNVIGNDYFKRMDENDRHFQSWYLKINNQDDLIEFLAAIPKEETSKMIIHKSPLLGVAEEIIWKERKFLKDACKTVLISDCPDETVKVNAIRVLVFLAEPSVFSLCGPFLEEKNNISEMAIILPVLLPEVSNPDLYKQQLLDPAMNINKRINALSILMMMGENLSLIYQELKKTKDFKEHYEMWDFFILMSFLQNPFAEGIPLIRKALKSNNDRNLKMLVAPMLLKLQDIVSPEATQLLLIALQDDDPEIRQFSAITLSRKRSNHALPYLIESYKKEKVDAIAVSMATAIVASGAKDVRSLYHPELNLPAITLWQCILAMRTRDESFSDKIVSIACDAQQNWQLRHIAILAAGRLPFEVALGKIFDQILSERSSLVIDQSSVLMRHSQISSFLLKEAASVYRIFNSGKKYFVSFWAEIFDHWLKNQSHTHGAPNGKETAEWLFDRVEYYGFPQGTLVADQIISELHIPVLHAAVLRSLRLCGRLDIIEQYIIRTYHEWFTAKCIKEIMKLEKPSYQLAEKLKALVQQSKFKDSYYLGRVIDDYCFQGVFSQKNTPETIMGEGFKKEDDIISVLSYEEIIELLENNQKILCERFVLDDLSQEHFDKLVKRLNPENDRNEWKKTFVPKLKFTLDSVLASQETTTSVKNTENNTSLLLRVALVASKSYGSLIPWHRTLMRQDYSSPYVNALIDALALEDNSDRFYEELDEYSEILIPIICEKIWKMPILKYVDNRFIPYFNRYVVAGNGILFEGLCTLAQQIKTKDIDPILSRLLHRWSESIGKYVGMRDEEVSFSRGFKRLVEHPRFKLIDDWSDRLVSVLNKDIPWFEKQKIVRILETEPQSYITIESRLFKEAEFMQFRESELDRLDIAAEKLFHMQDKATS